MEEQDVYKRARINFPRRVCLDEAMGLLMHIVESLDARVSYLKTENGNVILDEKSKETRIDSGSILLDGLMSSRKSRTVEGFAFYLDEGDYRSFAGLQFNPIVGYSLDEYDPDSIKFWDGARKCIKKYFQKTKSPPNSSKSH